MHPVLTHCLSLFTDRRCPSRSESGCRAGRGSGCGCPLAPLLVCTEQLPVRSLLVSVVGHRAPKSTRRGQRGWRRPLKRHPKSLSLCLSQ